VLVLRMMPLIENGEPSVPEIGPCGEKRTFKTYPNGYSEFASQVGFESIDSFSLDGDEDSRLTLLRRTRNFFYVRPWAFRLPCLPCLPCRPAS
jgi:hypothetical protein